MKAKALGLCVIAGLTGLVSGQAAAQDFPTRPVRILVGAAGAGGDVSLRMFVPSLGANLGQPVVIENRSGQLPLEIFRQAPADGYTLLMDGSSLWIGPLLKPLAYDAIRDFAPITATERSLSMLAVHSSVPAGSVKELVALAKARPGTLNYGTGASGSLTHLAAELFKSMAGINITHIPYKGGGEAVKAVLAGEVQLVISPAATLMQHVKAGRLKGLGVGSLQPSPLAPGFPTVASQGLPGFTLDFYQGLFAPIKTPVPIVRKLNHEIVRALTTEEMKDRYRANGYEVVANTPEEFSVLLKAEVARWGAVIKAGGIKGD